MSPSRYTEDNLVRQTTADYLAERLGWGSVQAHDREDFGPESLLGRASDREVGLERARMPPPRPCRTGAGGYKEALRYCGSSSSMPFTYQFMPSRVPTSRCSPSPITISPSCR